MDYWHLLLIAYGILMTFLAIFPTYKDNSACDRIVNLFNTWRTWRNRR